MAAEQSVPDVATLIARTKKLSYRMHTKNNRIRSWVKAHPEQEDAVGAWAAACWPILPASTQALLEDFLALKQAHGTAVEKATYDGMGVDGLVQRMLACRPLAFVGGGDSWQLRDGQQGFGGFEEIGTSAESAPLVHASLMSYDEIALSALMGVSCATAFINTGDRHNGGRLARAGTFIEEGVYVGLVGARFERAGRMEWAHVMVSPEQNTPEHGYGDPEAPGFVRNPLLDIWARWYGVDHFPSYTEAVADLQASGESAYVRVSRGNLFNTETFVTRMRATAEMFLREANARGEAREQEVYAHVVGLGLGVWKVASAQNALYVRAFADVLASVPLPWVADVDFSWIRDVTQCGGARDGDLVDGPQGHAVRIHFSKRSPADLLPEDDAHKLMVAMYAWDGNAFPGNEYWGGSLSASGDPAAACCSLIPQLQNPDVNSEAVCGGNLKWR